jgi:hypothetical protein
MLTKHQHDLIFMNVLSAQLSPLPDRQPQVMRDLEELVIALIKRHNNTMKDVSPPAFPPAERPDWYMPSAA